MNPLTRFSADHVVVGQNARMRAIFEFVKFASGNDSSVIITGESGTGKEVIAQLLHHHSRRRTQPFVAVSCALFSEGLIETELFGHERGAFTGAIKDKPGRFELARQARYSSTMSTTCRWRCRSNCCARCRTVR